MIGIVFYVIMTLSVGCLGKIYHSQGLTDPIVVAGIMLTICAVGFNASLVFIQRLGFLLALLFFPFNILYSFAFESKTFNGLEPIGGAICIVSLLSLTVLRR